MILIDIFLDFLPGASFSSVWIGDDNGFVLTDCISISINALKIMIAFHLGLGLETF
jgi:hypothetical protein